MSVSERFQKLTKNLRTTNDELISLRKQSITRRINLDFRGIDSNNTYSRFVGSYGRGTAIKGFSDVDLLVCLPQKTFEKYNNYIGNGQSALLQEVRNSIRKTYPNSNIGGDGQVVVVEFSDGIIFEVLPAFLSDDLISYTYADSNNGGKWKKCKPLQEISAINEQNQLYNKKIKHLVRMMKAWKKKNNVTISGMLLETLVMDFMEKWIYNDKSYFYYDYMTRDFLLFLSEQNPQQSYWLAWGSNQYVWRTGSFEKKASFSHQTSLEAISADDKEYVYTAKDKWRGIFGSHYEG
jgi:predicted nucleotidyltransferase